MWACFWIVNGKQQAKNLDIDWHVPAVCNDDVTGGTKRIHLYNILNSILSFNKTSNIQAYRSTKRMVPDVLEEYVTLH